MVIDLIIFIAGVLIGVFSKKKVKARILSKKRKPIEWDEVREWEAEQEDGNRLRINHQ